MELQQNTFGYAVTITTDFDLSSTTALRLIVQPPDDENGYTRPTISRLLPSGAIHASTKTITWDVEDIDLLYEGLYELQLRDESDGRLIASKITRFYVAPNL